MSRKTEEQYIQEITELNNQLINTQRNLHKKNQELERTVKDLQQALDEIKRLKSLLPICSNCKKIRNDDGYWQEVEEYISEHTDVKFSHGLCNDCLKKLYPNIYDENEEEKQ